MVTRFNVYFFSFSLNTVYEWMEWMWRMSERSGVHENEQVELSGYGE